MPNEAAVLESLTSASPDDGLYFFPGMDLGGDLTPEQEAAWDARYRSGPTGLVLYHPKGQAHLSARQLLIELLSNVFAAAVAALLVSLMAARYWQRVMAIAKAVPPGMRHAA